MNNDLPRLSRLLLHCFSVLVAMACYQGCSSRQPAPDTSAASEAGANSVANQTALAPSTEPHSVSTQPLSSGEAAAPSEATDCLAPEQWVMANAQLSGLNSPDDDPSDDFVPVESGLQITSPSKFGTYHAIHQRELTDNFEITATVVQLSEREQQAQGLKRPSPFSLQIGLRAIGQAKKLPVTLGGRAREGESFDARVRASQLRLAFYVNGQLMGNFRRNEIQSGHFYIELKQDRRLIITNLGIREDLDPDTELAASGHPMADMPMPIGMMPSTMAGMVPNMMARMSVSSGMQGNVDSS